MAASFFGGWAEFIIPRKLAETAICGLPIGLVLGTLIFAGTGLAAWNLVRRGKINGRLQEALLGGWALWLMGCFAAAYAVGVIPPHATGARYYAMAWPVLAVTITLWICNAGQTLHRAALYSLIAVLLLGGIAKQAASIVRLANSPSMKEMLTARDALVVDNVAPGVLMRILWYAPDETMVLAARQADLLRDLHWRAGLTQGAVLYISEPGYGNTADKRAAILTALGDRRTAKKLDGKSLDLDEVFLVKTP